MLDMWQCSVRFQALVGNASMAQRASFDAAQLKPDLRIEAVSLGRALFEVYLGSNSVVPDARGIWAQGARALLATEQVHVPIPAP